MANELVRPRVIGFLERQDHSLHLGAIARGAEVSVPSARAVPRELEAAGRLDIDRALPGSPGYRLRDCLPGAPATAERGNAGA